MTEIDDNKRGQSCLVCLAIASVILAVNFFRAVVASGAEPAISYNRDVRPILADKCFHCHGPAAETRKAELR